MQWIFIYLFIYLSIYQELFSLHFCCKNDNENDKAIIEVNWYPYVYNRYRNKRTSELQKNTGETSQDDFNNNNNKIKNKN